MWWLLLIAVNDLEYTASSVYATEEQCVEQIDNSLDRCVAAQLKIIELPETAPITVTVLPSVGEMGSTQ